MRWALPPGAIGPATGAISTGATATSISTKTIISIRTITSTASKAVSFNTTHNIAEMRRMVIEEPRTNLVVKVLAVRAELGVGAALGVRAALAELAAQVARVAPVEPGAQVAQGALAELVVPAVELERNQEAELERNPAVELERNREAEQERNPAAELERNREAEPARNQEAEPARNREAEPALARVAVQAPRTKSVTVAHHRGLVPAPKVEDLAVAAQTKREPVAAEAAKAWAVAG